MLKRSHVRLLLAFCLLLAIFHFSRFYPWRNHSKAQSSKTPIPNYIPESQFSSSSNSTRRAKAAFVILARNSDIYELRSSLRQLENRFNKKFHYPYVFLNDEPFNEQFIELTKGIISGEAKYGVIPKEHWSIPTWIDEEKARLAREEMERKQVIYGGSLPYRHMCRFNSGFFFQHPLLDEYDFYWRVEPSVDFYCDLDYDPFLFMQDNDLKYGFTISLYEFVTTIETLWPTTLEFFEKNPQYLSKDNLMDFISDDGGKSYNLCHFWSNFEIADLRFWRSEPYMRYFEYLDKKGGFFYERWGDAPVHSIAAALMLNKSQIHFFDDIGYKHPPYSHCSQKKEVQLKCHCDPASNFDFDGYSCGKRWFDLMEKWKIKPIAPPA
ncbi:uncharacterized protein VTP21DRAFT_7068 [Calcarisporiella thermophila]|uniref:uncharacterized protein n=1 Tax=Calcarisporiella thermophila TaxID=911321 RepID=UPI003742955D